MGELTGISWTDHTFNPWWICTEVSPACDFCYAREFAQRFGHGWGPGVPRRFFGDKHWHEPLKWDARARKEGKEHKIFSGSMCDIFDTEPVSLLEMDAARARLWQLIRETPFLVWQLLTKRPAGYRSMLPADLLRRLVWPGVTCESEELYHLRWPKMPHELSNYCWISYEPALGPLRLTLYPWPKWVVCGGESGIRRRPMELRWAEDLRKECAEKKIPFFMKQMSALTPGQGKQLIPADLRIQEFPA